MSVMMKDDECAGVGPEYEMSVGTEGLTSSSSNSIALTLSASMLKCFLAILVYVVLVACVTPMP